VGPRAGSSSNMNITGNSKTCTKRCQDIKGSVQRKLRWVKNSTNCWLLVWDPGTEQIFLSYSKPTLCIELTSVSGQYSKIIFPRRNHFHTLPILWCPLCCANTVGTAIFNPLTGEARRTQKNLHIFVIGVAPCFTYRCGKSAALRL
jgi:hypothetical protein